MNIKIRAFDKKNNKMHYYGDDDVVSIRNGKIVNIENMDGGCDPWDLYIEETDLIINLYTGLKDKNGVEIYEGDIFPMGVIGFYNGRFNGFYYPGYDDWEDGMDRYVQKHEVIGNIYQNPELLTNTE